jgi:hypothetical protein
MSVQMLDPLLSGSQINAKSMKFNVLNPTVFHPGYAQLHWLRFCVASLTDQVVGDWDIGKVVSSESNHLSTVEPLNLSTNRLAIEHVIHDRVMGLLVTPEDPETFCTAAEKLLINNESHRERLALSAFKKAMEQYHP